VVEAFAAQLPALRLEDQRVDAHEAESADMTTVLRTNASVGDGRSTADVDIVDTSELERVAPAAFARLARRVPDAEACLLVPQAASEELRPAHATPRVATALETSRLQVGEGVSGWVAAHRSRIVNSDPALDLGDGARSLDLRKCMSVPVFAWGDLVAVLTVFVGNPRGFTEPEVRAVGALAHEIGLDLMRDAAASDAPDGPLAASVA
jgi:hypothetical protein